MALSHPVGIATTTLTGVSIRSEWADQWMHPANVVRDTSECREQRELGT